MCFLIPQQQISRGRKNLDRSLKKQYTEISRCLHILVSKSKRIKVVVAQQLWGVHLSYTVLFDIF